MSIYAHETVPTQFAEANGIRYAYRRFGKPEEHLPNAQLITYPDSTHGAFYQHRKVFLEQVKIFFSDGDSAEEIA